MDLLETNLLPTVYAGAYGGPGVDQPVSSRASLTLRNCKPNELVLQAIYLSHDRADAAVGDQDVAAPFSGAEGCVPLGSFRGMVNVKGAQGAPAAMLLVAGYSQQGQQCFLTMQELPFATGNLQQRQVLIQNP